MSGWVKLHREMAEWEWYGHAPTKIVFLHLLLKVNHKAGRYQGHEIPQGAMVIGLNKLAEQTGLSIKQVRTALNNLKNTNEAAIKSTNKFSIITLVNWAKYQQEDKQKADKGQSTDKQRATSKEGKNNINKDINIIKPESVSQEIWDDFVKHRQVKNAPITQTVISGIAKEASRALWPLEDALREMCVRNWQGFKADWVKEKENAGGNNKPTKSDRNAAAQARALAAFGVTGQGQPDQQDGGAVLRQLEHLREGTGTT